VEHGVTGSGPSRRERSSPVAATSATFLPPRHARWFCFRGTPDVSVVASVVAASAARTAAERLCPATLVRADWPL